MACAHIFRRSMEYHSYLNPLRLQMQDSAFHAPAPLYHYKPFQAFPHSLQPQSPHLYGRYLFYTQKNQLSPSWFSLYLQNYIHVDISLRFILPAILGQALTRLVTVSSMCYHTSTSALSTSSSSRGLTNLTL